MKRLIAITIAAVMLMLPVQAMAKEKETLSFERSIALMDLHNGTLKKLQRAESDALKQYKSNVESAKNIDTNGFTVKFGNEDIYIHYGAETRLWKVCVLRSSMKLKMPMWM